MTTIASHLPLRHRLDGDLLVPGDPGFDERRSVWNAMIDRYPAAIARCTSTADVVAAVRFARKHGLEIGVRCGGHNIAGLAVPDGGLTTTAGNVSHTGVGGLTLGGGMGWLARRCGLACDNVVTYTLVTADGEVLHVTADEHPELFWGLRGGGGNFGIVTEFEFRLHPVDGQTLVAELSFAEADATAALSGRRELAIRLQTYGGAIAEVDDADSAFSHRGTQFEYVVATGWTDSDEDEARKEATRRCAAAIDQFAVGAYVNVLNDEGRAGLERAYSTEKLTRLTALTDAYDQDNVFRLNHNIIPSGH